MSTTNNTVFVKNYKDDLLIPINYNEVWRYSGYMGLTNDIDRDLTEKLNHVVDELNRIISYRVCYRRMNVVYEKGKIIEPFITDSKDLAKCLDGCSEVIVFAATIGISVDRYIARYQRISPVKALLTQALGAERVERLCDVFCDDIKKKVECSGFGTTKRYSPGYGDLPLETQKDIFNLLDCNRHIGISLNKSLLMSPSKSVTAIFGLKKNTCCDTTNTTSNKCNQCSNKNCEYRIKNIQ